MRRSEGREQQRAIADLKFLFRNLRSVLSPVAWELWGDHYPDRAVAADREVIVDLIGSAEGERSAALAKHWLDRQPGAFHVIRGPGGKVRGVVGLLDLTTASAEDRAADPGTAAAWSYVERTAPARAGETVTQCRFIVDAETYQGPSPTLNAVPILTLQRQLTTPASGVGLRHPCSSRTGGRTTSPPPTCPGPWARTSSWTGDATGCSRTTSAGFPSRR